MFTEPGLRRTRMSTAGAGAGPSPLDSGRSPSGGSVASSSIPEVSCSECDSDIAGSSMQKTSDLQSEECRSPHSSSSFALWEVISAKINMCILPRGVEPCG